MLAGTVNIAGREIPKPVALALGIALAFAAGLYLFRRPSGGRAGSSLWGGSGTAGGLYPPVGGSGTAGGSGGSDTGSGSAGGSGGSGGSSGGSQPPAAPPVSAPLPPAAPPQPPGSSDGSTTVGGGSPGTGERTVPAVSRWYVKATSDGSMVVDRQTGESYSIFGAPSNVLAAVGITSPAAQAYYGAKPAITIGTGSSPRNVVPAKPDSYWNTAAGQSAIAWYQANPGKSASDYLKFLQGRGQSQRTGVAAASYTAPQEYEVNE